MSPKPGSPQPGPPLGAGEGAGEAAGAGAPSRAEIERDLAFAIDSAREAGQRALRLRASGRWKDEGVLADIADQATDGYLQGMVRGRCPADGLLSEETADSSERLGRERAWIIDPLDGTREYSQGRADWAVHVALTIGGRCALAAMALPVEERVIWGVALPGAERSGIEGQGVLANARDGDPSRPPRLAVSRSHTPGWIDAFARDLGAGELKPWGSAGFKVSRLLLGEADVYVHKKGLKEWDTCAPETVARALGWRVTRLRGEEHRYNRPDPRNSELVVCRPAHLERVLAALASSGALA